MFKTIHYIHFDSIDSTNTWTKKNAHHLDPSVLTCVSAAQQTEGHGKWARSWHSPHGLNIYATFFAHVPYISPNLAQLLSLACATVLQTQGFHPQLKWPNDILLQKKKLAGVLCESVNAGVAIGIGLNVNMSQDLLDEVGQPATSLLIVSGKSWDLTFLLHAIAEEFAKDIEILYAQGFSPFHARYEDLLAFKGEVISCFDGTNRVEGICHSILPDGCLQLILPGGQIRSISAGELFT